MKRAISAVIVTALLQASLLALALQTQRSTEPSPTGPPAGREGPGTGRRLIAVDVFGNVSIPTAKLRSLIPLDEGTTVTVDRILAILRPQERATVTDPSPPVPSEEARLDLALSILGARIEREALGIDPVAFAQFTPVTGGDRSLTLVLDVAERGDPGLSGLRSAPEEDVPLPDELDRLWQRYRDLFFDRLLAGRPLKETMEAGHWRTSDPTTRDLEDQMSRLVGDHLRDVSTAALRHRDPKVRQMSAYMLTWSPDPAAAVQTLLEAIRDPIPFVRNEAARALIPLAALSIDKRAVDVPIEPVVDLLNRPTATDRNKAAAVLTELAADPARRPTIKRLAERRLEAMAASRAPLNRDIAIPLLALLRRQ